MPVCPICNAELKQIHTSHLKKHGITASEFKLKYPNISFRNERTYEHQQRKKAELLAKKISECSTTCLNCNNPVISKVKKFCNSSCSATYNNKHRNIYTKTCKSICTHCKQEYDVLSYRASISKYCSIQCCNASRRDAASAKRIEINCDHCNKTYLVKGRTFNMSANHFCGNDCKIDFYRANPHIRGIFTGHNGKSVISSYRKKAFSVYPHKCHLCGYDKFEDVLQVHHIDHNRNNNDISNLIIVCPTCHSELHKGYSRILS